MFKKIPWKTILLTLFVWTAFWDIKDTINDKKALFIFRWIFSDKNYAKNIEIQSYILTDEQISYMLAHPNENVRQPTKKELFLKPVSLVLRVRNLNGGAAEGQLSWSMPEKRWNSVYVNNIPTNRNTKQQFSDIIISLGTLITDREEIPPDPVSIRWDELYVYR